MKQSILTKLLIALLPILIFTRCEKEETKELIEESTITINDESYEVSTASLSKLGNDGVWKLVIEAIVKAEDKSAELEEFEIRLDYNLHALDKAKILGEYSIGDVNKDGMVNEDDAFNEGYITDAFYQRGDVTKQFVSGYVKLYDDDESGKRMATFDCRDENNVRLQGNALID